MTDSKKITQTRRFARTSQADAGAGNSEQEAPQGNTTSHAATQPTAKPVSKIAQVIALLKRGEGATLAEMIEATGWQQHTTRAALTGLKKKGHTIERSKRNDTTCYRITGEA